MLDVSESTNPYQNQLQRGSSGWGLGLSILVEPTWKMKAGLILGPCCWLCFQISTSLVLPIPGFRSSLMLFLMENMEQGRIVGETGQCILIPHTWMAPKLRKQKLIFSQNFKARLLNMRITGMGRNIIFVPKEFSERQGSTLFWAKSMKERLSCSTRPSQPEKQGVVCSCQKPPLPPPLNSEAHLFAETSLLHRVYKAYRLYRAWRTCYLLRGSSTVKLQNYNVDPNTW